ncbi:MAG: alpha/beta hydrolase [Planctomycetota bacterium JB042]
MPTLLRVAPAALIALLLADDALGQRGRRGRHQEPVELKHFTYEKVTFDAPSLDGDEGGFGIFLPVGYDEDAETPYPWVLWLHGMFEDGDRFHAGGGAKALDALRGEGRIPALVLVTPTAPRRTIYANGEAEGDIEDYVLKDVTAYVEEHYRVAEDRAGRALMGVSMGGMGALRIAFKNPRRYATVAVHSAAALPPDPTVLEGRSAERVRRSIEWLGLGELLGDPIDPEKWALYIPSAIVEDLSPEDLHGLRIFFDAGTEDRYGFGPPNAQLHERLDERGIDHSFRLVEGGGHSWGSGSMPERLERSLEFVAAGFAPEEDGEDRDGADGETERPDTEGRNGSGGR